MTQKEKELLLGDLSARLPYNVKLKLTSYKDINEVGTLCQLNKQYLWILEDNYERRIDYSKPYLFPLSSMTEEQKNECFKGTPLEIDKYGDIAVKDDFYGGSQYTDLEIYLGVINWLLKNHFDIHNLIPIGLANDATGLGIY